MALKALMLRKKINDKKAALDVLRARDADFKKREQELEASIAEANTEEEKTTVETAVGEALLQQFDVVASELVDNDAHHQCRASVGTLRQCSECHHRHKHRRHYPVHISFASTHIVL